MFANENAKFAHENLFAINLSKQVYKCICDCNLIAVLTLECAVVNAKIFSITCHGVY